jgi:hypothetical protein
MDLWNRHAGIICFFRKYTMHLHQDKPLTESEYYSNGNRITC